MIQFNRPKALANFGVCLQTNKVITKKNIKLNSVNTIFSISQTPAISIPPRPNSHAMIPTERSSEIKKFVFVKALIFSDFSKPDKTNRTPKPKEITLLPNLSAQLVIAFCIGLLFKADGDWPVLILGFYIYFWSWPEIC